MGKDNQEPTRAAAARLVNHGGQDRRDILPRILLPTSRLGLLPCRLIVRSRSCSVRPNPAASTSPLPSRWKASFLGTASPATWRRNSTGKPRSGLAPAGEPGPPAPQPAIRGPGGAGPTGSGDRGRRTPAPLPCRVSVANRSLAMSGPFPAQRMALVARRRCSPPTRHQGHRVFRCPRQMSGQSASRKTRRRPRTGGSSTSPAPRRNTTARRALPVVTNISKRCRSH
jgi:hypothetical protein